MKAAVYHQYGSPDMLHLEEVEKPMPKADEVLVKVHAASVNSWDWDLVTGKPRVYRLMFGLLRPKYPIIGSDIAGTVEAVGENVRQFKPGDEVFGDISDRGFGAFAEYACAHENMMALKSAAMTFEQAAAIPQAGLLALQGLRYPGRIRPGQKVLINGAGGGVGTFAIQMAKLWGATVTAVDHATKLDLLKAVGADHVIDYTQEDFTKTDQRYDLILDVVANRSVLNYKKALSPEGVGVMVGGTISAILQTAFLGSWVAKPQKTALLIHKPNGKDLQDITALFEAGHLKAVIDRVYPLSQAGDAVRHLGEGKALGKVIITCC